MRLLTSLLASLVAIASSVYAQSSTGSSVLVVLEQQLDRANFALFFEGLEKRGYNLTFRAPKASTPVIIEDDVPAFSHVILFAPTTKSYAPDITPQSLVELLTHNVNIIVALSPAQTPLSSLAAEFSLTLPPPHTPLLSHFPPRAGPATILPIQPPASHPILTPALPPVLFAGVPHALGTNPLLVPILRAPAESFAAESVDDGGADAVVDAADRGGEGLWAGSQMGVVSGFQTRDGGGRVLFVGGVEVFSDAFARAEVREGVVSGNAQFSQDVAAWVFQESLVLRIELATHAHAGAVHSPDRSPEFYTTNDEIEYVTYISKWDPKAGRFVLHSDITDLQLEFTMLDPHVRTALAPVRESPGKYAVGFRAPDRHGVFKFVVDYRRKGWTHLQSVQTVPVVPPRHDGYPRFLSAAWPYYAGAVSTSVAFVAFSVLWLAGDVGQERRKAKGAKAE